MIFRSLALTDFGTYAGENRIDLAPEHDRPVVLVGGSNGAGKTTILEAILLCLHGRRGLGRPMTNKEYEAHIASRVHSPPEGRSLPREAGLRIVLDHTEAGEESEYVVERTWRLMTSGGVRERLYLARNGAPVDELPESSWQDFLDGLVPPGVAHLFLFDGEQIQALAEDATGEKLADAVRRLLGLDVVGQLRTDLARYVAKAEGRTEGSLAKAFAECDGRVEEANEKLRRLHNQRSDMQGQRDEVVAAAERERERFAQQGGALAAERATLEKKHRRATERASVAAAEVRELVAGLLPFAICPVVAEAVDERLRREQVDQENEVIRRRLNEVAPKLSRAVKAKDASKATARTIEEILLGPPARGDEARIHDLTPSDRALLADQIARARGDVPGLASSAARRLSRAEEDRLRTRELLEKVPEDSAVSGLLVALQGLEREVGGLDAELARIDEDLKKAGYELTVAERERRRAHEALRASHDVAHRSGLALRAASVLEEFGDRLQATKLDQVELETARYFNRLSRKGDLLSAVRMDPETFRVSIDRWDGTELAKERLSAGERQLLAVSLLWALAKVSRRPLPVVIDTPLARLDQEHRDQLLREYFPRVSHQVIVLSTDTEVDAAAAQELAPVTARAFQLDHDAESCRTVIRDGYFFSEAEAARAG